MGAVIAFISCKKEEDPIECSEIESCWSLVRIANCDPADTNCMDRKLGLFQAPVLVRPGVFLNSGYLTAHNCSSTHAAYFWSVRNDTL